MLTLLQQLRIINGYVGMIKCKKKTTMHRKENQLSVYTTSVNRIGL